MSSNFQQDSVLNVQVHMRKLLIPNNINTADAAETYFRNEYPGIQIRCSGLMYGDFPHDKRIPYISLHIDGCGYPVGATLYYLK